MLKLNDVTWLYEHLPMRFTFSADRGEQIAVLGPSGAGKSTLLSLIAGFNTPVSGTLTINGEPHADTPPSRRPVSMLFQENNLFSHLTIRQNIGLGMHPGLKLSGEQRDRLAAIAARMGIGDLLDRLPEALSGGQRQRAALARCLVRRQPVLLLDEPFSALDPALRQEMLTLVSDISRDQQLTLLMVSHSVEDALQIAPRSLVVAEGAHRLGRRDPALLSGNASASGCWGSPPLAADHLRQNIEIDRHQRMAAGGVQRDDRQHRQHRRQPQQPRARHPAR
ncbi:Thiamine import ATP-binding protein ThiQ [Pluralibacter gergoviae]|nr:Thiamine import ATP-binding protein ThiQ [Pluralibacter gergoviae]